MTDPRPPLAAFDDEVIGDAAEASGVASADLRALVARHQESVRDLPGVDDIVYEWRKGFHRDPLVRRTAAVYVLALPAHVWEEFAAALDVEGAEREALVAAHDRQARALVDETAAVRFDEEPAVVLTRP